MAQDVLKKQAAQAALDYILPHLDEATVIGVGTGSTVNYFIDLLAEHKLDFDGAVSSSEASTKRLKEHNIPVYDLNGAGPLDFYVDGADEISPQKALIKGGGAALTREKIVAEASRQFICIADDSKSVGVLGEFPLPIEVIPMARSLVAREVVKLGGDPMWRENVITDNGGQIIDCYNMSITDPIALETKLNQIPGVICNGLFALRRADVTIIASKNGVEVSEDKKATEAV